jgi:hypothetical protein
MNEVKNVAASIRQKLLNRARARGEEFQRTLVRYAIERFLYRLSQHAVRERFILKGAMLFITWPQRVFRPTGDLDLLGFGPPDSDSMKKIFLDICMIEDASDGILFEGQTISVEAVREDEKYQGVRITMNAMLGTAIIPMQVDVGFGDNVYPAPKRISFPCLLEGMQAPEILAYPPETVIAEKLEAMVRYGEATSRLKDFYDIWTIAGTFDLDRAVLVEAIRGTFRQRSTKIPTEIPFALTLGFVALPEKRKMWEGFLRRNPPALPPPPFDDLVNELRQFLGPVIEVLSLPETSVGKWSPKTGWAN